MRWKLESQKRKYEGKNWQMYKSFFYTHISAVMILFYNYLTIYGIIYLFILLIWFDYLSDGGNLDEFSKYN